LQWVEGPGRIDMIYAHYSGPTGLMTIDSALNGDWHIFVNAWKHLILPATILGLFNMATLSRMTRSLTLDQLSQTYILTAVLKGLSPWKILWKHALRNICLPLITLLMMSVASLLEGAVIIETIFAWPGLGSYLTQSLLLLDYHAFLGATLLIGTIFISCNIFVDIFGTVFDPRSSQ